MNILLDAYYDTNFGDDLFVETITGMFPGCKFYSFLEYYPPQICSWAERISNLYLLPECSVFLQKNMFDAYLCVGGDIFPDKGDFSKRKAYVESVKQGNGVVAFLGFSLFHEYCETSRKDLMELMEKADIIAPRDEASVMVLQQILPNREIRSMADLAFSSIWKNREQKREASNLLGISVRKPLYAKEAEMEAYCDEMAKVIMAYMQGNPLRRVRLLSLSNGSSVDAEVAEAIVQRLPEKERTEHLVYAGDTDAFKDAIAECDLVLCTRLHAMISCIAMNVPFIPIVYEVKMEHVLKEIHYTGAQFSFTKLQGIQEALLDLAESLEGSMQGVLWDIASVKEYLGRSVTVLNQLNCLLGVSETAKPIVKTDTSGAVCQEKEYGRQQAEEVVKKNKELDEMAESIQKQQTALEECQNTIAQYLKTIEELNEKNAEYFKLIDDLNQNISGLSQEMEQLSQDKMQLLQEKAQISQEKAQLAQEKEQLLQEKAQLIIERDSREEMLMKIKPFFISRTGSTLTKVTGAFVRSEEIKKDWALIQEYFADEKAAE